jgi:glycerol-3-phosphate dehydrogenase
MNVSGLTIFPLPSKDSKGVLISPTVSGNIIVGPTSILTDNSSTVTTVDGLAEIDLKSKNMLNSVNLKKNIRVFSGVRTLVGEDFVIEFDKNNSDIINITGICSPGLTAAPAIAEYVVSMLGFAQNEKIMIKRQEFTKIHNRTKNENKERFYT